MGRRVRYTTRERVADAFDVKEAAHRSAQIDRAIDAASDSIDQLLTRHKHGLAPVNATRYFEWPGYDSPGWRLWLDENELISVTSLTAGATVLSPGDYFLEPVNSGPPYTYIEVNLNTSASFDNSGTRQRAIAIEGVFGHSDDQTPVGTLTASLNSSATTLSISDSSVVGVGHLLTIDEERLIVVGRSPADTGDTLQSDMNALKNDQVVDVTDGSAFTVGEILLIGTERMRITSIAGNNLTVERAWDGSTLATHNTSDAVFAFRTLVVERGARGTMTTSHLDGAAVTRWTVPYLVEELCVAEAMTHFEQEVSAYSRRINSDEAERDSSGTELFSGRGLSDVRKSCRMKYGRKFRKRAV